MSWKKLKFSELYEIPSKNGLTKPSKVRGNGYKMINMGELFACDRIYNIPMELVPLTENEKEKNKVLVGDLLFARQSLVLEGAGKCSIVMDVSPLTVFESHIIRVRLNKEIANPLFYYYYFKSPTSPIKTIVSQCAQAGIRASDLSELTVDVPELNIQKKIANILSKYDNLIENNQKQIKLLEEAAQRLYKEWFVDLRFPGYESATITDGVPEGWSYVSIDDMYSIKYGKNLPTTKINQSGMYPVYGANGVIGYYESYNCDELVTLITSRGNGSGDVSRTHHNKAFITNNSFIVKPLQKYEYIKNEFVYWQMKNLDFKSICTGSAQPQLTNSSISTLKVLCPSEKHIVSFCSRVCIYFQKIECLLAENQRLAEARDRLLPKLMSGEIEV